jgi:alpha-ribazole phosphatase
MNVILMRHGRTAGNIDRRYNGRTDEPLCAEGIKLAIAGGADPGVRSLYVSPLKRAVETARIKFPNASHVICADLREMDFGDFEGRTADEMADDPAYIAWLDSNCTLRCPNGDQLGEFSDKVCRAFDAIVRLCIDKGERQLVIVAHGGSLMAILSRYGQPTRQYQEWYMDNCCGFRGTIDEAQWASEPLISDCDKFETLP